MEIQKDSSEISREEFMSLIIKYNNNIANNQNDHKSYFDRANCYLNLGNLRDALNDQNKAIKIAEKINDISQVDKSNYYSERGYVNACMSNLEQAFKDYDMAVKLNPTSEMYYNRGVANYNLKRYEEAKNDYEQAIALNPNHVRAISSFDDILIILNIEKIKNKIFNDIKKNLNVEVSQNVLNKLYKYINKITNNELKLLNYKLLLVAENLKYQQLYKKDTTVSQYTRLDNIKFMFNTEIKKATETIKDNNALNIRMNNAIHMNDPLEGAVFNILLKNIAIQNTDVIKNILNTIYPSDDLALDSNTYLTSFSKSEKELLPMWVNYGGDSVGTEIKIPVSLFDKIETEYIDIKSNTKKQNCCLYSVIYLKSDENNNFELNNDDKNIEKYIENIADILVEIATIINNLTDKDNDKINALDIIRDILDQVRFLFKSDVYAYEEEVRVVKLRYKDDPKGIFLSEVDDVLKVPKLYIELEKDIPYEEVSITLGAKVQKPKEVANYLKHIGVKEVTKSKMPYQ